MKGKQGIILLNGALLAEAGSVSLANNQTVVVDVDPEVQKQRLAGRGHTPEEIEARIQSQFSTEAKLEKINQEIEKTAYGKILSIKNNGDNEQEIDQLFNQMVAQVDIF
jgi:dephospho-CoA kinase